MLVDVTPERDDELFDPDENIFHITHGRPPRLGRRRLED